MTHSPHIRRASLRRSRRGLLALAAAVALGACASADRASGPYTSEAPATRDPAKAQALTAEASGLIVTDPQRAEQLLRDALSADLYHGPAHNNLGVIHLGRGDLYEAASEFEWARKLMPGHPDPRMNLALTLEQAGRADDAIQTYKAALETYPGHMPTSQALTRLEVRSGQRDQGTQERLREIALRGETASWRSWAAAQLAAWAAR